MLRVSDLVSGLIVAGIGLAIFLQARTFPSVGGVAIAPSFYPSLIGGVLMLLGVALAVTTVARREVFPLTDRIEWLRRPGNVIAVVAVALCLILYSVISTRLGFVASSLLISTGLFIAFRIKVTTSLLLAFCLTVLLYLVFVKMLRVPLPYGLIEAYLP